MPSASSACYSRISLLSHLADDELIREIADFVAFVLARRRMLAPYADWTQDEWHQFALSQFLRETEDDVEYSLDDAQEVYTHESR